MALKGPEAAANVICAGVRCNRSFAKRGNQLYCRHACRENARRVQDRRRKREQRRPEDEQTVAERAARERERHLAAKKSEKPDVSADRIARRFRLPLRRVQPDRAAARRRAGGLLLQILPGGLSPGVSAAETTVRAA